MMRHALFLILCLIVPGTVAQVPAELDLPDLDGQMHRLSEHRGKWVVVNFWDLGCTPCIAEVPELVAFQKHNRERGAIVIAPMIGPVDEKAVRFALAKLKVNYPVPIARDRPLGSFSGLKSVPTTYIVSPAGNVLGRHRGAITREEIERVIRSAGS